MRWILVATVLFLTFGCGTAKPFFAAHDSVSIRVEKDELSIINRGKEDVYVFMEFHGAKKNFSRGRTVAAGSYFRQDITEKNWILVWVMVCRKGICHTLFKKE